MLEAYLVLNKDLQLQQKKRYIRYIYIYTHDNFLCILSFISKDIIKLNNSSFLLKIQENDYLKKKLLFTIFLVN